MKNLTLCFLFALLGYPGFSQRNIEYLKGYVITLQNDTVFGSILAYPDDYLTDKVVFVEGKNARRSEYTPNEISGFHIGPDRNFTVLNLTDGEENEPHEPRYFALEYIRGKVDLLVLFGKPKTRFFVRSDEFGLSELQQTIEVYNGLKTTDDKYKRVLGKYFYLI